MVVVLVVVEDEAITKNSKPEPATNSQEACKPIAVGQGFATLP